jgi:hypothetical protein
MGKAFARGFEFHKAGLSSTGNYLVSGVPYLSGGIEVPAYDTEPPGIKIEFPTVTKSITIRNDGAEPLWFAFSANAISGTTGTGGHRISIPSSGSFSEEFRVVDLYLISDTQTVGKASVIASLTGVRRSELPTNWSGSIEVHDGII